MDKKKICMWLHAAGVRALKTVAQTAVATIGTAAALGQVDWRLVASASVLAGVLSLLTSVAGLPGQRGADGIKSGGTARGGRKKGGGKPEIA